MYFMFSPQFHSRNTNHHHITKNNQNFDWQINCGCEQYAIEEVKDQYKRVISIKLFRHDGCQFEFAQEFCAHQFHGAFFANIRAEDCHCNGTTELIVDVYNDHCYLCGSVILTNTHKKPYAHDCPPPHHHLCPPQNHHHHQPCSAPPTMSFPCPAPHAPCHHQNPCLTHTVSRSDVANCKLLSVDVKDAHVTSVNEICVKPLPPITSKEKLCNIIQCCKKTTECLEEFDPHFANKLKEKGHAIYSGPVTAEKGWINIAECSITFDGLQVPCVEHATENCIKF